MSWLGDIPMNQRDITFAVVESEREQADNKEVEIPCQGMMAAKEKK